MFSHKQEIEIGRFKYVLHEPNPKTKPKKYQPARLKRRTRSQNMWKYNTFPCVFIHQKWPKNLPGYLFYFISIFFRKPHQKADVTRIVSHLRPNYKLRWRRYI